MLACLAAAGCRDAYPPSPAPLDRFYYPAGMAVHPTSTGSALVVVSTDFDLQYDVNSGGSVISVDPDASDDTLDTGVLAVIGTPVIIGSFGGEVAIAEASCTTGWPGCGAACPALGSQVQGGNGLLVTTSRNEVVVYTMGIDSTGALFCGEGCATIPLPTNTLDPYGVTLVCGTSSSGTATAYVSELRANNGEGILGRFDLNAPGTFDTLDLASPETYTSAFDPASGLVFVGTQVGTTQPLRWITPLLLPAVSADATWAPEVGQIDLSTYLAGTLTLDLAVSNDGTRLYAALEQLDTTLLPQGAVVPQGGLLAVFDLTPDVFGQPGMGLIRAVNTCLGGGQVRVLPGRENKRDLVALTCDTQGALVLYDDDVGKVVSLIGLDAGTGQPLLGRQPYGLAVEPIDPHRAVNAEGIGSPFNPSQTTSNYSLPLYQPSPCTLEGQCVRLYVASFAQSFVSLVELDPAHPEGMQLVKRIGIESAQ